MRVQVFILLFLLVSCKQEKQAFATEKQSIDLSQVETVYLKKYAEEDSVRLTKIEVERFVSRWNSAKAIGHYKYHLDFWINLILKDGRIRKFRSYQDKIKEKSDLTFSMPDSTFFPSIWERKF